MRRLKERFGLLPVEYPSTRKLGASPAERARDIHAAFSDPEIKAVIASIGGEDQIKVLSHLHRELLASNPKPFFGYSDNTNLLLYLWNLGLVGYHGGVVMVQFGRPGAMHPLTEESLHRALFTRGEYELLPAAHYTDEERSWTEPANMLAEPELTDSDGWAWHGPARKVTGPGWGGSLEIIDFHLRASRYLLPLDVYTGAVLYLETSEELPPAAYVYRVLMGMGERGLLARFAALLVARPKAWSFEHSQGRDAKRRHTSEQADAVLRAMTEYGPDVPVVLGVDFGHTDPQLVIPSGGAVTVDSVNRRITVIY